MSATDWPTPDPEWKTLVRRAAYFLDKLESERWASSTFPAQALKGPGRDAPPAPSDGPPSRVTPIVAYRCREAVIELFDFAPEWARSVSYLQTSFPTLIDAIRHEDVGAVIRSTHDELAAPPVALKRAFELSDTMAKPYCPGKPRPYAVATIASVRARAALLPRRLTKRPAIKPDARLISDLLAQARLLTQLARVPKRPQTHPFTIYHVARAAWLTSVALNGEGAANVLRDQVLALKNLAKELTEQLLAQSHLRGSHEVEAIPLAYCAATMALPVNREQRYVAEALRHCAIAQEQRGAWTDGRIISKHNDPDSGEPVFLSSHEVALTLAECMSWAGIGHSIGQRYPTEASRALVAALAYAGRSVVQADQETRGRIDGWRSRSTFAETVAEALPTAAVLRLAVTARRVATLERSAQALEHFDDVWDPGRGDHVAPYLVWDTYMKDNEPDSKNPILPGLDKWFVQKAHEQRRTDIRPWSHPPAMSAILFGPPGTTKTTIVKAMAHGLNWPLVTLSPGTFIRDGLENVERRAIEVFALLRDLSGAVVLFDECDELFRTRERSTADSNDQTRSISAFMTASMLPKLQDLRDRGRVFFVIATNYLGQIDPAVKRIGRIDRMVGVGWPDRKQRAHIIKTEMETSGGLRDLSAQRRRQVIELLADKTRYYIRGDIAHFAQALVDRENELRAARDRDAIESTLNEITDGVSRIDDSHIEQFVRDALKSSTSHAAGRGEMNTAV